jgi:hypothetical protein
LTMLHICSTNVVEVADRRKSYPVQVRLTEAQYKRLQEVADAEFGGSTSDALRQALTDAHLLRMARDDYLYLFREQGLRLPRYADRECEGATTFLEVVLSPWLAELREEA